MTILNHVFINRKPLHIGYLESLLALSVIACLQGSDYIHANYVSSYKKSKAFILTQGKTALIFDHAVPEQFCCFKTLLYCWTSWWPEFALLGVWIKEVPLSPPLTGPTKKTLVDFWRMVWEQRVRVVVMTTKCVELGRHKCCQYWPDEGVVQYGEVAVTVTKLQQCDGHELRIMKITRSVRLTLYPN